MAINSVCTSSIENGSGRTTEFTINSVSGLLTSITDPDARKTSFQYNDNDQLTKWINPEGDETRFTYDVCFRLKSIILPGGEVIRFGYMEGETTQRLITNGRGITTTLTLDAEGNISQAEQPEGVTTEYTWDSYQRILSSTDARSFTTNFTYDTMTNLSRRIKDIAQPIGTLTFGYSDKDNARIQTITDQNSNVTTLQWDFLGYQGPSSTDPYYPGALTTMIDAESAQHVYSYTSDGQLKTLSEPLGITLTWDYDNRFRRESATNGENETTTYTI